MAVSDLRDVRDATNRISNLEKQLSEINNTMQSKVDTDNCIALSSRLIKVLGLLAELESTVIRIVQEITELMRPELDLEVQDKLDDLVESISRYYESPSCDALQSVESSFQELNRLSSQRTC